MTHETIAQRNARWHAAEREARISKEVAEYPHRLTTVLTRAGAAAFSVVYAVGACDNKLRVTDGNNSLYWDLAFVHSSNSQEQLVCLEDELARRDTEAAEFAAAQRQYDLVRSAFKKLSKDEQQALGLNNRFN
jgi:hypothetical protein